MRFHIKRLLFDEQKRTLYAVTEVGAFRSTDGGASWQPAGKELVNKAVRMLVLDSKRGTLYAGASGAFYARTSGGVFRSTDSGTSWQLVSADLGIENFRAFLLDEERGILYAGTDAGVFRSTDGGTSWQLASAAPADKGLQTLVLDRRSGTLYAGTVEGMFRSSDAGTNWQRASTGLTTIETVALLLDRQNGTLYAGTAGGVFRSTDGGANWQSSSLGLTNPAVRVLLLDGRSGVLYAGTTAGVFRSTDSGANWQATSAGLTNKNVQTLMIDERTNILYAGTVGGVFRSTDGGTSWQPASEGLTNKDVRALVLDGRNGILYAGTVERVFRSIDNGTSWQTASLISSNIPVVTRTTLSGTPSGVVAMYNITFIPNTLTILRGGQVMWQNNDSVNHSVRSGVPGAPTSLLNSGAITPGSKLYFTFNDVGTYSFFSELDSGMIGTINVEEADNIQVLLFDTQKSTLYAGTDWGVFRSPDSGTNWELASADLVDKQVRALLLDGRSGTLLAGTAGGVFRSTDAGTSWQTASTGLGSENVQTLLFDEQSRILYAGTDGGVFRLTDNGTRWQYSSKGLRDIALSSAVLDRSGTLFVSARDTIYRLNEKTRDWERADKGLVGSSYRDLWTDSRGMLLIGSSQGTFQSDDAGQSWKRSVTRAGYMLGDLITRENYVVLLGCRWNGNINRICNVGVHSPNTLRSSDSAIEINLSELPDGNAELLGIWGSTIARAEIPSGYQRVPLVSYLALGILSGLISVGSTLWSVIIILVLVGFILALRYANIARPFGIPFWAMLLAPSRLESYANPDSLETAWNNWWSPALKTELLNYGDATTDDLVQVPGPFRNYTLRRYDSTYASTQALDVQEKKIRLLAGDRLRRWRNGWFIASKAIGRQPGLPSRSLPGVQVLAEVLSEVLALTLDTPRDFVTARAYPVEAPALRLRIPNRFPLVFVADPNPNAKTVQMLVDAVDALKETDYFALIVPLEPYTRELDVAGQLRRVIEDSEHVQDFIVLSQEDILDILIARDPVRPLIKYVLGQVDLKTVSPFQTSGPVPERMFFGREAEIKALVENSPISDFAVVGNRKIGKTSLLQRTRTRLDASMRARTLFLDCQTVRNSMDFYAAFHARTGIALQATTPEGFRSAIADLHQEGPPIVLLLDEVDALLADDEMKGEPLTATWRAMAQSGICHFIFCGSTGLAQRLDHPKSVFFNFPQPLPLGYLATETARLVLTHPLETLGIEIENPTMLLGEAVEITSGHPNIIQYIGQGLVNAANQRQERRILISDLVALKASTDFTEFYLKTVWGEAGPLEKLITLVAPEEFNLTDIETALAAVNVRPSEEALDSALKMLRIYSILQKHERIYSFVPRAFPDILHRTQEVDRLVSQEKRRLEAGGA